LVKIPTTQLEFQNGAKVDTSKILNKQQLFGLGDFLSVLSEWGLSETEIESLKAILEFKAKIDVRDVINELIHSYTIISSRMMNNFSSFYFVILLVT
jgi:predicted transcriptional regulator